MPVGGASNVVFFGTPEVAVPHLESLVASGVNVELVVTRPDVRRARGSEILPSPVKLSAQKLGLRISHDANDVLKIASQTPNLMGIVVAFGELISTEILSQVPMINVHFSLLPRWRGAAPVERAILAGDEVTGVCIMQVVERLDEGVVYAKREVTIDRDETASSLIRRLNEVAIEMMLRCVKDGPGVGQNQIGDVRYAKKIKSSDLKIDWSHSSEHILRQIRIGDAFTFIGGRRVKILRAKSHPRGSQILSPGEICEISKTSCVVAANDGAVSIEQVQPEGKAAMQIAEWLNGARISNHSVFGS